MSAEGKTTRIPKFSFGFRRAKVEDETSHAASNINRSATPTNPPTSGSRSAESSPKVGRSKSLRLPRPAKYGLQSHSQSSIPESHQNGLNGDLAPEQKTINADSARGRSLTVSTSSNHSSRSNSPSVSSGGTVTEKRSGRFGFVGGKPTDYNLSQADDYDDAYFDRSQRRTQSFSSRVHTHTRNGSLGSADKLIPSGGSQYGRNHPARRSKTPTSTYKSTSSGLQQAKKMSQGSNGEKMSITRTSSLGKVNRIQRVEEGVVTPQQQKCVVTRRASQEARNKRPVSLVGRNNTPDLNTLASEIDQSDCKIPSSHGSKRPPPLRSRRSQSALDHHPHSYTHHTPSPTEQQPVTSTTSSNSSNEGSGTKTYEQPTIASVAKSSRPNSSHSHYKTRRQGSFGSQTNLSSASTDSVKHDKKKSLTSMDSIDAGSGRGTPTSGRSTPVKKKGRDSIDGNVSSTTGKLASGLPPRTPYRVARTMVPPSSGPVGINELEGSVLLEADDYLRVCHDVKALKTSLLRLKRELQTDSSSTPATGSTASSRVGRTRSSPAADTSGSTVTDLKKKLKQMTTERDKALEEVGSLKKQSKSLSAKVTSLNSELSSLKTTHSKLEDEYKQVEGHRNMLLDKVERLHADKHKLEDRLMAFEKASIYEQTISDDWLDELDGEDSMLDVEDIEEEDIESQRSEDKSSVT